GLELAGYRSFSEIPPRENSKAVSRGKLDRSCRACGIGLTEERRAHHSDNSGNVCVVDGVERVHTELHVAFRTMTLGHGSALEAEHFGQPNVELHSCRSATCIARYSGRTRHGVATGIRSGCNIERRPAGGE